jgi:hypothetical protein
LSAADADPAHDVRVDALQRGGDCRVRLSQRAATSSFMSTWPGFGPLPGVFMVRSFVDESGDKGGPLHLN